MTSRNFVIKFPCFLQSELKNEIMVGVAQSVERLVVAQVVAGSNPVTHPPEQYMVPSSSG